MSIPAKILARPYTEEHNKKEKLTFINESLLSFAFIPKDISIKFCNFKLTDYHHTLYEKLDIYLPKSIKNSVDKRQAEFLAGRYMAMSVLKSLGLKGNNIGIGKHRNPVWPQNIIASITHTKTSSLCAAAFKNSYLYLGIDLEDIISVELVRELKNSIIIPDEETILKNTSLSFEQAFTLVFSAKESLFKALYPSVRYYFDFSAARITEICPQTSSFTLVLAENLTTKLNAGMVFTGYFAQIEQQILTIIAE